MADIPYIQQAQEVKITGQDSGGTTVNYVTADTNGNLVVKDAADGPVTPGTVAANSILVGGQFNTAAPTLTNTQQASMQLDSSGNLKTALPTNASTASNQATINANITNGNAKTQIVDASGNIISSVAINGNQSLYTTMSSEAADGGAMPFHIIAVGGETPTATLEPLNVDANANLLSSSKIALTASSPTATSVGVASGSAVASNANRKGLILTNTSNKTISLGIGVAAVSLSGIVLTPNGVFIMDEFNFTTAVINAISTGAASNLAIQEFTT